MITFNSLRILHNRLQRDASMKASKNRVLGKDLRVAPKI